LICFLLFWNLAYQLSFTAMALFAISVEGRLFPCQVPIQNTIYLGHKRKVMVLPSPSALPSPHLATVLKNIESLGFTFSERLIACLQTLSVHELFQFYANTIFAPNAGITPFDIDVIVADYLMKFDDQVR
jgi:hypothetical protein